jgi:hypothetical protein
LVVEPGDSLWSISEEHLGAGATPEQVAYEVQRIFELNRERIGENPNLIFPGQQFFLVSPAPVGGGGDGAAASEQPVAVAEPEAEPVVEQRAAQPIVAESEGVSVSPAAENGGVFEEVVPEDGVSEGAVPAPQTPAHSTDEQVQSTPAESVSTESTPAESTPAESTPAESAPATTTDDRGIAASLLNAYDTLKAERRLLGVGIIALTLIIAALMAWRLPMRRNVEDRGAWGTPQEYYYENYAPPEPSPETAKGPEGEPSSSSSGSALGAPPEESTTPEPSVSSSSATNGSPNGSPARGAEDAVVAVGDTAADAAADAEGAADAAEGAAAGARTQERLGQERLRRVRHLRRIRQRRTPSNW